jgi:predicted DNA binding protein
MKQTAIQQAIAMVRSREESMLDTLMGKHTAHHLQQVERGLYELLDAEKKQIKEAYKEGYFVLPRDVDFKKYYEETYGKK